jgi:hypothetical protein
MVRPHDYMAILSTSSRQEHLILYRRRTPPVVSAVLVSKRSDAPVPLLLRRPARLPRAFQDIWRPRADDVTNPPIRRDLNPTLAQSYAGLIVIKDPILIVRYLGLSEWYASNRLRSFVCFDAVVLSPVRWVPAVGVPGSCIYFVTLTRCRLRRTWPLIWYINLSFMMQ